MSGALAIWSDNFVRAATAVMVLAFFAHAAEWAFGRERRTRQVAAADEPAMAMAGSSVEAHSDELESSHADFSRTAKNSGDALTFETDENQGDAGNERAERYGRIGVALSVLATALLGLGVLTRGLAAERVPWSNLYEFATTGGLIIGIAYLLSAKKFGLTWLGLPLTGLLAAVLTIAIAKLYTPVSGLIPALQSYWLIIHVSAAVTATGVFTVGMLASVLQILRARAERKAIATGTPIGGYLGRLPSAEAIDRIAYRLHAFAFPIWTFAMICGAAWAAVAWGRYWGWDPKETWMFITWVCYAAYLHARSTAGWRSKVSWISIAAYGALMFNLVGVNFLVSGLHSYAGI